MRIRPWAPLAAMALCGLVGAAQAAMNGQTLQMQWYAPDTGTPVDMPFNGLHRVTDGVEMDFVDPLNGGFLSIDLQDTRFVVRVGNTSVPGEGFYGFALRDVADTVPAIAGLRWVTGKPTDKEAPWLSFDADTIWFNFALIGAPERGRDPWSMTLVTEVQFEPPPPPVPEPGRLALLAIGAAVVALLRRRRDD